MAFALILKANLLITALIFIAIFFCYSVAAEGELDGGQDIVKALSCFENKLIYAGCDDAYRLNPSGNIRVPPEATDFFCSGPCLIETQLVLECIDNMLSNFIFYNKATVQQMRYALNSGCSYSRQRGNFNLEGYIGGETNNAREVPILIRCYLFIAAATAVYLM
ncbi:hypothetical protein MtrunA17_Chr1g0192611 [Medicago truncatula]|uniref:DUF7731 domain-containing protein n=1 Tax=Medicago truncatula TaxID=3880 RepID=G7I9G7_MEDTR|nr:uncharacterized protein LOC11412322 [Medicago truncatula]AES61458.2 hypothetical protein MTR_1g083900 [Medicago truncatula]RHN80843.1 hypothetical protein MtrunA17_Chr1g0192611 [Medicago truncatula]